MNDNDNDIHFLETVSNAIFKGMDNNQGNK